MKSLVVLASAAFAVLTVAQMSATNVVGAWEGDSKCVNLAALPGCKDEHVIYHITQELDKMKHPSSDTVLVRSDKVVDKKPLVMGYLTFKINFATFQMVNYFKTKKAKGAWSFSVKGNTMTGTLTKLPEGVVVRKITLKRVKK